MIILTVAQTDLNRGIADEIPMTRMDTVKAYIALTKPKILVMLLFTAYAAMFVGAGRVPHLFVTIFTLVGLALSSAGAATLNMWFDRDIDALMKRTEKRPIPMGLVKPSHALIYGLLLGLTSVLVLGIFVNWLTSLLSLAGFVYYVVIYTMWLKRRTPQNIVIGGGAGAFPPLVGWAAVTGHLAWAAWVMFLIIFFWTPPHFWALALYKNEDYVRANIPMMPVVRGPRVTKFQSLMYAILLLGISLSFLIDGTVSVLYFIVATVLGIVFIVHNIMLWRENDQKFIWAKRTFIYSLVYLPTVFVFMIFNLH